MSWRKFVAAHIGPGTLCGLKLGDWLRLLIKNRFREMEQPWKGEVASRWRRCFDEWGYAV